MDQTDELKPAGEIAAVEPGSLGEALGLRPGDHLLAINGHPVRDVIDVQFYAAEERLELLIQRENKTLLLQTARDYDDELGLQFTRPTFDGLRECNNHCPFCFLKGLPPGLRPSLYVRDDDYRYSFLFGNFITLTNLTESDWTRLAEQRLSPLHISVHATEPELRRRLLGRSDIPDILAQLRRLGDLGITVHTQIVLQPEVNDGPHLATTVAELSALYPTVASIGVVPAGQTRYRRTWRPFTSTEARQLLHQIQAWQTEYRRRYGLGLVYAADEWYFLAGEPVPPPEYYDGFPQLENGIGLVRDFWEDWEKAKEELRRLSDHHGLRSPQRMKTGHRTSLQLVQQLGELGELKGLRGIVVCGTLIRPVMEQVIGELNELTGTQLAVVSVENRLFGPMVTVSGLLTGQDIVSALQGCDVGEIVLLPRTMFDATGLVTLDDWTPEQLAARLGVPVRMAARMTDLNTRREAM